MTRLSDKRLEQNDEDVPLVRRCQEGDFDAYGELVSRHQAAITGLLFRFSRDTGNLEDLVQETFIRAWRGLGTWQPEQPYIHWLRRIAVRVGLDFCRSHQRTPFARIMEVDPRVPIDPLDSVAGTECSSVVERRSGEVAHEILAQLPPEDRTVLTLLYLEQMPLSEIAAHFGWSAANAKIKAFRARKKLRSILDRYGYTLE
jgi:RNA polymerase sigma-70 factor (ECF subfamily)